MRARWNVRCVLVACVTGITLQVAQLGHAAAVPQTTAELTANSSDVVRGEVLSLESQWNDDETFIFTIVTLRVDERYKGNVGIHSEVTILVPGGEVGEVGLGVEHAAKFEEGQEVIVFLRSIEGGRFSVTAWEQGKFTLENGQVKETQVPVASFEEEIRSALDVVPGGEEE